MRGGRVRQEAEEGRSNNTGERGWSIWSRQAELQGGGKSGGSGCILYADDTTAKVTGEMWPELEMKLRRTLEPLFQNLKDNRVKVNEDIRQD